MRQTLDKFPKSLNQRPIALETLESRQLLSASVEIAHSAPRVVGPAVVSVTLSDGTVVKGATPAPCKSMLTSIAVVFSTPVTIQLGALSLKNLTFGSNVNASAIRTTYQAATRTATFTFPTSVGGSLTDGRYNAVLQSALIKDLSGRPLDPNADGVPNDYVFKLARLFGDADGDAAVAPADVFVTLAAYHSMTGNSRYQARFDLNSDGAITDLDLLAAENRYGMVLNELGPSAVSRTITQPAPASPSPTVEAARSTRAVTNPGIKTIIIQAKRKQADAWVNFYVKTLPAGLTMAGIPTLSQYGGDTGHKFAATGSFYAKKVSGKWWLVDPEGNRYFDNSVTTVAPRVFPDNAKEFLSKFGTGKAGNAKWADWIRNWLRDIGYYSVAPWGTPSIQAAAGKKTNYTLLLDLMSTFALGKKFATFGVGHTNYRNGVIPVFDPTFPTFCATYLNQVLPQQFPNLNPKTDSYLVGYMTDNELPWDSSTLDNYLKLPATNANRLAAQKWLAARGHTTPNDLDRTDFKGYVAETYFRITSQAIRTFDPKHMILGCRMSGGDVKKTYLVSAARKYVNVLSVNFYDSMDPGKWIEPAASAVDIPYLITEFYTKGADSGLPNTTGYGYTVKTQADRGAYYQQMLISTLTSAHGVGTAWLTLMDNDLTNTNPEGSNADANKGLMTVHYPASPAVNPYKALTDRIRDLTRNLYPLADFLRGV